MTGILRGFDPFMNIVLEDTVEFLNGGKDQKQIGSVVCNVENDGFEFVAILT